MAERADDSVSESGSESGRSARGGSENRRRGSGSGLSGDLLAAFLGTFVLSPAWIIGTFAVCAASGGFFLGYTHHIVIRYVFCLVVIIIVGLALMRRRKGQGPIPAEDGDIQE